MSGMLLWALVHALNSADSSQEVESRQDSTRASGGRRHSAVFQIQDKVRTGELGFTSPIQIPVECLLCCRHKTGKRV
jgi:hypothetical protein